MRLALIALFLGLVLASCLAEDDLRTMSEGSKVGMSASTSEKSSSSDSTPKRSAFEQAVNKAYRRATGNPNATNTDVPPEDGCIQFGDDLCHLYNGDCASCIQVQGCGYCNDAQQCLQSSGDNPATPGCNCEVWMNEPRQCVEDVCAVVSGCEECSLKPYCVWCPEEQLCMPGGFFGMASNEKVQCRNWKWLRCHGTDGKTVLIIAGCAVGAILLLFTVSCVVYNNFIRKTRHGHGHHAHEELVSNLLEDERNILSGIDADEPLPNGLLDPALDIRDIDNAALNERADTVDEPVALEEDMVSQSEDEGLLED